MSLSIRTIRRRTPELNHADAHAAIHTAHQRFLKEGCEPCTRCLAALLLLQLREDPPDTKDGARNGGWCYGSALEHRRPTGSAGLGDHYRPSMSSNTIGLVVSLYALAASVALPSAAFTGIVTATEKPRLESASTVASSVEFLP